MNAPFNKQHGVSVIKFIVLTPLILIGLLVLVFVFTLLNKAYWDYRVKQLCEKDGGVTVFERVELSAEQNSDLNVTSKGIVILPDESNLNSDTRFFIRSRAVKIQSGFPVVFRFEQDIIRRSDRKILSKHVTYSRRGGDFPTGLGHSTYFLCGNSKQDINLSTTVITVQGK